MLLWILSDWDVQRNFKGFKIFVSGIIMGKNILASMFWGGFNYEGIL